MRFRIVPVVVFVVAAVPLLAQPTGTKSPREALQPFGDLVGAWKGTGNVVGPISDVQKNFWTEKMKWGWQFKGNDAWITVDFEKSKYFKSAVLRPVPGKDQFTFTVTTLKKEKEQLVFVGELREKVLTMERDDGKETQKLVLTMLHANRFLYRYEVKAEGRPLFSKKWQVGASPDGVPFAAGDGAPVCVVSGGRGTSAVSFMGKTYYVCCSGCADEFRAKPAFYVKEFEDKLKAKKK